jgi:hypothetical protein
MTLEEIATHFNDLEDGKMELAVRSRSIFLFISVVFLTYFQTRIYVVPPSPERGDVENSVRYLAKASHREIPSVQQTECLEQNACLSPR